MFKTIICLTGLSGAGKTTVCRAAASYGVPVFYTADIARRVLSERTPKDKLEYGANFARPGGLIAATVDCAIQSCPLEDVVVLDSVRSPNEWRWLQRLHCSVRLVAVVCSHRDRLRRLQCRDNTDLAAIQQRDDKELGQTPGTRFNVGQLICRADYYIDTSDGADAVEAQLGEILGDLESPFSSRQFRCEAAHPTRSIGLGATCAPAALSLALEHSDTRTIH
jgi:dephospho-CoA kinase